MAASPAFAATPRHEAGILTTGNSARDGSGSNIVTIFTAPAAGSKIDEITVKADGNPADSTVLIFLHDNSNYHIFDEFDLADPAAGSATLPSFRDSKRYPNLRLPSAWSIRASVTVTPTSGGIQVHVDGGDF